VSRRDFEETARVNPKPVGFGAWGGAIVATALALTIPLCWLLWLLPSASTQWIPTCGAQKQSFVVRSGVFSSRLVDFSAVLARERGYTCDRFRLLPQVSQVSMALTDGECVVANNDNAARHQGRCGAYGLFQLGPGLRKATITVTFQRPAQECIRLPFRVSIDPRSLVTLSYLEFFVGLPMTLLSILILFRLRRSRTRGQASRTAVAQPGPGLAK